MKLLLGNVDVTKFKIEENITFLAVVICVF